MLSRLSGMGVERERLGQPQPSLVLRFSFREHGVLRVISIKKLRELWTDHPRAETALRSWHTIVNASDWSHFPDLKQSFPSADIVGRRTVFDISGNRYRLIACVNYQTKLVFVLAILTHAEYDQEVDEVKMPTRLNRPRYAKLLAHALPHVIRNDRELKQFTKMLLDLLAEHGMSAKDLWPLVGSKGITSEILNGKRGISISIAKRLGEFFRLDPAVLIDWDPQAKAS